MNRPFLIAGILSILSIGALPAAAHEDYRVIGTITNVTTTTLDVKQTKDDKTISMTLNDETVVTRDETTVGAAELTTGLSVVVDAHGDSLDELLVQTVRIVPSLAQE